MAICTYITESERIQWTTVSDNEINELLHEVRKIQPEIIIHERAQTTRRFLRKPKIIFLYTVYKYISHGEAQIINFCQEHKWSINTAVTKSYVITFLLGWLNGYETKQLNKQSKEEQQ